MMRNIAGYLLKSSIVVSLLFFSASCKKQQIEKTYYYSVISKGDTIPHIFFATVISEKNGIRKAIQYRYNLDKNAIVDTLIEYYKLKDNDLYKLRNQNDYDGECFLSVKSDTCIVFNHLDPILNVALYTKHCFIGKKTVKAGQESDSIEAYVFVKEVGQQESVTSKVYYNKSFVLVKEEYIKGFSPEFRRELVNNIPEGFAFLLNSNNR